MPSSGGSFESQNPTKRITARRRTAAADDDVIHAAASLARRHGRPQSRSPALGSLDPRPVSLEELERLFEKQQRELTRVFEHSIIELNQYVERVLLKQAATTTK